MYCWLQTLNLHPFKLQVLQAFARNLHYDTIPDITRSKTGIDVQCVVDYLDLYPHHVRVQTWRPMSNTRCTTHPNVQLYMQPSQLENQWRSGCNGFNFRHSVAVAPFGVLTHSGSRYSSS